MQRKQMSFNHDKSLWGFKIFFSSPTHLLPFYSFLEVRKEIINQNRRGTTSTEVVQLREENEKWFACEGSWAVIRIYSNFLEAIGMECGPLLEHSTVNIFNSEPGAGMAEEEGTWLKPSASSAVSSQLGIEWFLLEVWSCCAKARPSACS